MKQVYTARHATDAHLVRGLLEAEGIAAAVRGEYLAGGIGELPADLCTVWVMDDRRYEAAVVLIAGLVRGPSDPAHPSAWTCPGCGERLERQFTECWNCGTARPPA